MLGRLQGAVERERAFVADAAHELRTPLAILKGELELATSRERTPQELRAAAVSAAEEADRLTQLAEDLLVIARSDQGRLGLRLDDVEVDELLAAAGRRFTTRAVASGRRVRVMPAPGLRLRADRLRLEQALGNLVENALRHGGGDVTLSARESAGGVELRVLDEGRGLPDELLPVAFERFTRADEARGDGGAGLGLSIVEAIARSHGGSAHAANRDGGGAEVWMVIPDPHKDLTMPTGSSDAGVARSRL
jgi:signal transduction histidine kinase